MEKDASGHYGGYDAYPAVSKQNATNSLKRPPKSQAAGGGKKGDGSCCRCFRRGRSKTKAFFTGLATNLGICVLLFGYTLIGSVVFLAIEGGASYQTQIMASSSSSSSSSASPNSETGEAGEVKKYLNESAALRLKSDKARARTVENIWDITVSLNILYRDNWTRLAAQEITRFQEELMRSVSEEWAAGRHVPVQERRGGRGAGPGAGGVAGVGMTHDQYEWTFAKAFLYSLTVLTTIGYGNVAPRTSLGKAVTMGYALLGIPLTLLYLSSVGSILSRVARGVFSRALCCCLCSNCGYCCYDERRMAEKERRMKRKRQQLELQQQLGLQEPFYVRAGSAALPSPGGGGGGGCKDVDSLSGADSESRASVHGWAILAPVLLCLAIMLAYICLGAVALYKLEGWPPVDGFYFCFMSLTTIGFGDLAPGGQQTAPATATATAHRRPHPDRAVTVWFCSAYIMSGMALTAMCFNVVHDEIVHRLRHQEHHRAAGGRAQRLASAAAAAGGGYLDALNGAGDPFGMAS